MKRLKKVLVVAVLALARLNQNSLLALLISKSLSIAFCLEKAPFIRRLIGELQPLNPLRRAQNLPEISVLIVVAPKDFATLPLCVSSLKQYCGNPISRVDIVLPDSAMSYRPHLELDCTFHSESSILPGNLVKAIEANHPQGRFGWVLQQVVTLHFVRESLSPGVLVIDADTALTAPRIFLEQNGRQILSPSREYHLEYENHATRVWGRRKTWKGLSFVTHHQLMQPEVVRMMFPNQDSLATWVREGNPQVKSPVSEYHSYGRQLLDTFPRRVLLARWSNYSVRMGEVKEGQILEEFSRAESRGFLSISLHSYNRSSP